MAKQAQVERQHSDSILTDDRGWVRLSDLSSTDEITVRGMKIKGSQIPLSIYTLECSHIGKGIAVDVGNVFFCNTCSDNKAVASIR